MARAGAADLLRAVSGAADPDPGQGRSRPSAGRRRRRRAVALGAAMSLLCLALRPLLAAPASTVRPSPRSSRARPAGRPMWRSRSPAISSATPGWRWPRSRWSRSSRWSMSSASRCWRITPRPKKQSVRAIVDDRGAQSPDLGLRHRACAQCHASAAARIWHEVADALGRSSLAIGLLVTGAGLHLEACSAQALPPASRSSSSWSLMPVLAMALALWFGLTGSNLAIVAACSAVPASSERLRAGPPDGRRRAPAGADHHAADHSGGGHDADRDRAGRDVLAGARQPDALHASPPDC